MLTRMEVQPSRQSNVSWAAQMVTASILGVSGVEKSTPVRRLAMEVMPRRLAIPIPLAKVDGADTIWSTGRSEPKAPSALLLSLEGIELTGSGASLLAPGSARSMICARPGLLVLCFSGLARGLPCVACKAMQRAGRLDWHEPASDHGGRVPTGSRWLSRGREVRNGWSSWERRLRKANTAK